MCRSCLLCIFAYVMFLQFHLPDSYQECMDMVVTGGAGTITAVGRALGLPQGYKRWKRQEIRRLLRNIYSDYDRSY